MAVFIIRRLIVSFFILLVATFLVYVLVANSGDPLDDLRTDQSPNRAAKVAQRIERLQLNVPVPERYAHWVSGVAKCAVPGGKCDLGLNRNGAAVSSLVGQAVTATLRLLLAATVLAIVLGVSVGIISALRQYSGFDYTITFAAFLFFSTPVFWVAVLLKQYGAIKLNNWLSAPTFSPLAIGLLSAFSALTWQTLLGGDRRRRLTTAAIAFVGSAGILLYLSAVQWFRQPALGVPLIAVLSLGSAVGITVLVAGLRRRPVLYSALATAAIGIVAGAALQPVLNVATWGTIFIFALITVAVGVAVGWFLGGLDREQAIRAAVLSGLATGLIVFVDRTMRALPSYTGIVGGRPVGTIGSNTPNFSGDFWQSLLDTVTHLVLPTAAIMLISFATYSRYTRSSMLEVMNQDFVRTARAKGLTERTVVMRHAFRNALIPVTTLMAFDFGGLIGGAIITETVFGWQGMGQLFRTGLIQVDPNPVMGFFVLTAVAIVVFNMIADITYAYLDPRIRLN